MMKWLQRIRGTIGTALTWAVAWSGVGAILVETKDIKVSKAENPRCYYCQRAWEKPRTKFPYTE